ncbi:MAG: hypothetical protein ACXAAT_19965 [Candidatus Hodarchaeales archaeon]
MEYHQKLHEAYGRSPYFFRGYSRYSSVNLREFREIGEDIEKIQNALEILALGINYKNYTKFRLLTPAVLVTLDGAHHLSGYKKDEYKTEDVEFCINFVIESATTLQELV